MRGKLSPAEPVPERCCRGITGVRPGQRNVPIEELKQSQQEINPNEKGLDDRQDWPIKRLSLSSF